MIQRPNFTRIPNALLDNYLPSLSECELKVMLFILRKTEGFHKDKVTVSLARIADHIGMDRTTISRACKNLVEMDLLVATKNGQDGAVTASTYEPNFEPEIEGGGVAPTQHPIDLHATGGVAPGSTVIEERNTTKRKELTPIVPLPASQEIQTQELDLEDNIQTFAPNAYRRMRRPRLKLGRRQDALTAQRLEEQEQKHGPALYRACLLNYLAGDSQWLRENNWTINRFLQNPESYAPPNPPAPPTGEPREANRPTEAAKALPTPADAATPVPAKIDYPERWNRLVPAAPVDWDWERSNVAALRLAELDDVFVARFDEICQRVQKIHTARPGDQKYITFNWILKREGRNGPYNWWKVLQDCEWMETPDKPRGGNSDVGTNPGAWVPGKVCATVEQVRERRAWQEKREAAGKHTDSDKAVREGDLST